MKRTGFKRKTNEKKESKGLFDHISKEKKDLFQHLKKESKDEEWFRVKKDDLNPYFISTGLYETCELSLSMCIGNVLPLQYAHSKKRGEIALEEPERGIQMREVVRACTKCHEYIEHLEDTPELTGHEQMYKIVIETIERRNRRLARWKKVT